MKAFKTTTSALCIAALLSACGGSSSSPSVGSGGGGGGSGSSQCSLSARQDWVLQQLQEWYLFPSDLDTSVNKNAHSTVQSYIDALVAPARAKGIDRGFTYITSIAEENAYYESGSTAGFGFRVNVDGNRVFLSEVFESAPAGGVVFRGTEITAIGTSASSMRSVSSIIASEGAGGIFDALGPSQAGITRVLDVVQPGGATEQVTLAKADYNLQAVSSNYGTVILQTPSGEDFAYVNLRTFIDNAEQPLIDAFRDWRAQGIDKVVFDFRYNGGGLVRVADLIGDLTARNLGGQVFSYTTFRASKSSNDETDRYTALNESIAPMRVAIISTDGTASASELVANSFPPYLDANVALVGENSYGKPVGQIAQDRSVCDDRLRIVAFKKENADREGEYFNGLATTMPVFCPRTEDLQEPFGSTSEPMIAEAAAFLDGGAPSCTAPQINGVGTGQTAQSIRQREPLPLPKNPTPAQREMPGLF